MITRKDLIVSVLCTFCLATVLFTMMPVQSAEWDPWLDVKEDGRINVLDLIKTAGALGTMGDTTRNVNVTNWPEHQSSTIIVLDNATIRFTVQDVNLGSVDVAGFGHVSVFLYYYIDGNVDLRLYPKCLNIQWSAYTEVSMHTMGIWYTSALLAYEVSSPVINLTLHSYGTATTIYLTVVLYCYN